MEADLAAVAVVVAEVASAEAVVEIEEAVEEEAADLAVEEEVDLQEVEEELLQSNSKERDRCYEHDRDVQSLILEINR